MKLSIGGVGKLTGGIDLVDSYDYSWSCDFSKGYNREGWWSYTLPEQNMLLVPGLTSKGLYLDPTLNAVGDGRVTLCLLGGTDDLMFVGPWHSNYGIEPIGNPGDPGPLPASVLSSGYKYITFVVTPLYFDSLPDTIFNPYMAAEDTGQIHSNMASCISHINGKLVSTAHGVFVDGETDRDSVTGVRLSEMNSGKLTSLTWDLSRGGYGDPTDKDISILWWWMNSVSLFSFKMYWHGILISSKPPNVRTLPIRTTPGGESR